MARQKATITVDPAKLAEAKALLEERATSAVIDRALTEVIRLWRVRRDIANYTRQPPTDEEAAIGRALPDWADLADETDWETLWPDEQ